MDYLQLNGNECLSVVGFDPKNLIQEPQKKIESLFKRIRLQTMLSTAVFPKNKTLANQ